MNWKDRCRAAAVEIRTADTILIGAGAGMGVDSGLPDFRGNEGFWKAYPPFKKAGISFIDAANPKNFFSNPRQAWGFYGHRFQLYSSTLPHPGFDVLRNWAERKSKGYFVFTSNVDGHFQAAGFDTNKIVECHGSINHWQCSICCNEKIRKMSDFDMNIDASTFLADEPIPRCPECTEVARPNILMFGDSQWIDTRTNDQVLRYNQWQREVRPSKMVIIEIGAGTAVPTVRWECETVAQYENGTLIRINPRDDNVPQDGISIKKSALEAILEIDKYLKLPSPDSISSH